MPTSLLDYVTSKTWQNSMSSRALFTIFRQFSSEPLRNHSTQTVINDIIVRSRDLRKHQEAFGFLMFSGVSKGNIGKKRVKDENYAKLQGELEFLTCI